MKKRLQNKDGSSLLMAVVVMMIVTVLSMSLLVVSFSLFKTSASQSQMEQCKEMSRTLSVQIEEELSNVVLNGADEYDAYLENPNNHEFWLFLRQNMFDPLNWPAGMENAKELKIMQTGVDEDADAFLQGVTVKVWYENESTSTKDNTTVKIQVISNLHQQTSIVTSIYHLQVKNEDVGGEWFNKNEVWTFTLLQRN